MRAYHMREMIAAEERHESLGAEEVGRTTHRVESEAVVFFHVLQCVGVDVGLSENNKYIIHTSVLTSETCKKGAKF